jgi:hypothetical protein
MRIIVLAVAFAFASTPLASTIAGAQATARNCLRIQAQCNKNPVAIIRMESAPSLCRDLYEDCMSRTATEPKQVHTGPLPKDNATSTIKSNTSKVVPNPQPLPPKDRVDASAKSNASKVMLNPQPLPPKDRIDASAKSNASKVMLNQQPLPPKDKINDSKVMLSPPPLPPRVR